MPADAAAILSVGTEILLGQITDTNAAWLADALAHEGWRVGEIRAVDDDLPRIVASVHELTSAHGVLILTGGLGPTADDLTRDALAQAAGVRLVEHPAALASVEERFRRMEREMSPANRVQALIPEGTKPLSNPIGTAPGIAMRLGECRCYALPGVPPEMRSMFNEEVLPALGEGPAGAASIRELHLWGIGESDAGSVIGDLMERHRSPDVGTRAHDGSLTVRILGRRTRDDESLEAVAERVRRDEETVRERLGKYIFGAGEESPASVLLDRLREKDLTLAVAESCTGGLLGAALTGVPGASDVFIEGFVTYTNAAKTARLGVPEALFASHGAVSEPAARAMARGARDAAKADLGIGITGVAGPGGGTEEKPVGLVHVAVCGPGGLEEHVRRVFPLDREGNRRRAVIMAMHLAWGLLTRQM
jgi:nicotinamide-nucleotide amidase